MLLTQWFTRYDVWMAIHDLRLDAPKRLAHLPLIMDVLRRSRVMEVIVSIELLLLG